MAGASTCWRGNESCLSSGTRTCREIDECVVYTPCQNGGNCTDRVNDYTCYCDGTGYKDKNCSTEINECLETSEPCKNGGQCIDEILGFACNCTGIDFNGPQCENVINDCDPFPCKENETCTDVGYKKYICTIDNIDGKDGWWCKKVCTIVWVCIGCICGCLIVVGAVVVHKINKKKSSVEPNRKQTKETKMGVRTVNGQIRSTSNKSDVKITVLQTYGKNKAWNDTTSATSMSNGIERDVTQSEISPTIT